MTSRPELSTKYHPHARDSFNKKITNPGIVHGNHSEKEKSPSYLETRFENDIKTLVQRTDRLESLMERLLEANLANNELIGDMFKELKMFVITKRVQDSKQFNERPKTSGAYQNDEIQVQTQTKNEIFNKKRVASNEDDHINEVTKKKRFGDEEQNSLIFIKANQKKEPSETEFIPDEQPPEEDHDYFDDKHEREEEIYIETEEEFPQKSFHLPLKTLEELQMFDEELKTSEEFESSMKDAIQPLNSDVFDMQFLFFSLIDSKLINKPGSRYNNSRSIIRKTYLFEKYVYENFAKDHLTKKEYTSELDKILSDKPTKPDPDGINLPIMNQPDLKNFDERLKNSDNREKFMKKLQNLISSDKLQGKQLVVELLSKILSVDLIMMHNWEGKHGKQKLSAYENIFNDCMRTVIKMSEEDFEIHVKKALRTLQNREHIHMCRVKKRLSTNNIH